VRGVVVLRCVAWLRLIKGERVASVRKVNDYEVFDKFHCCPVNFISVIPAQAGIQEVVEPPKVGALRRPLDSGIRRNTQNATRGRL